MSLSANAVPWLCFLLAAALGCAGGVPTPAPTPAGAAMVTGTVTYRERIALPPGATVTVRLQDVSRADAPAEVLAVQVLTPTAQVPIPFALAYDPARIDTRHSYSVGARIEVDGKLWFISDTHNGVLTQGGTNEVEVVVRRVPGG
jgi:putative lipoprotein